MLEFRNDKCPLCGGVLMENTCYNGNCMLGQFTKFAYIVDGVRHKVSGIDGDVIIPEGTEDHPEVVR